MRDVFKFWKIRLEYWHALLILWNNRRKKRETWDVRGWSPAAQAFFKIELNRVNSERQNWERPACR